MSLDQHIRRLHKLDNQNKLAYCEASAWHEQFFCQILAGTRHRMKAQPNPERERNPYAIDLIVNREEAELKTYFRRLWSGRLLEGIPPRHAFTFNVDVLERYLRQMPEVPIYCWMHHADIDSRCRDREYYGTIVRMTAIELQAVIDQRQPKVHELKGRIEDRRGNHPFVYILDSRWFERLGTTRDRREFERLAEAGSVEMKSAA